MTGIPKMNFPAFEAAAKQLRETGIDVVSPAELDDDTDRKFALASEDGDLEASGTDKSWGDFLARDVKLLADDGIEAIVVLPGWEDSRGARLETFVGRLCGLPVLTYPDLGYVSERSLGLAHGPRGVDSVEDGKRVECKLNYDALPPEFRKPEVGAIKQYIDRAVAMEEERVVDPTTGGEKGSKQAVLGDLCPKALMLVAQVAGFGRRKYNRLNYLKGFDWSLSYDACQRHLHAFWAKEDIDPESGLPHLAHAAWQCLCLLAFGLRGLGKDDRP
jgi:hypothetical protein